ncbi:hypothetical protein [Nocardia bovistercoris]|uniref:Uncharacterized protein n=1 Tax=Nocardia bovistercoris TaxID=2785916 RepID=A0A931IF02_9NOCA|nr:hypothetical protein [Nocardia bovistercoris]MBH0780224.1 hypothetical protein [Nocardia bovistercoris]
MHGHREPATGRTLAARAAIVAVAGVAPVLVQSAANAAPIETADVGVSIPVDAHVGAVAPIAEVDPAAPLSVAAERNDPTRKRSGAVQAPLVGVDPGTLHLPDFSAPAVAPIQAPEGKIRVGSVQMDAPEWLPADITAQVNDGAAGAEASLAQTLDSAGFDPARSDRIAAEVVGKAAIGASVGSTLVSPLAGTSALIGAATGFVAGTPFAPAGWVVVTALGAGIGYGVIAAPAMLVGGAVGAAVGAVEGYNAVTP